MIVTLTPNPSLDRTVALPGPLIRGGVNRLSGVVVEPGGKGVNVARVLASAGQPATAVLPAAAEGGAGSLRTMARSGRAAREAARSVSRCTTPDGLEPSASTTNRFTARTRRCAPGCAGTRHSA